MPSPAYAGMPAVLRHQIGDLEFARHPGVARLERRKVVDHAIAPPDLAIVDLQRHNRRGEGLRRRANLEDGVGIDRLRPAHALHAEALRVDHLVVLPDRDRHARHIPLLLRGPCKGLELAEAVSLLRVIANAAGAHRVRFIFDPTSSAAVHAARFMRLAARLVLAALGLAFARPACAGWTVNATGDCVESWVAPPAAQGPVAMLNAPALPLRSAVGGAQVAAAGNQSGSDTLALTVLKWPA